MIQSHLQYGLAAWGGCSGQNKKRIVSIQKRAIRIVSKSYFNSHTEPRMKKLGILRLDELYSQQCATLIHDVTFDRAPKPIKNMLTLTREATQYNLRNHHRDPFHVRTPVSKCKVATNSFCHQGPLQWNKLPKEIQEIRERNIFKNRLKTHFLNNYSSMTNCNNPNCTDRRHHH